MDSALHLFTAHGYEAVRVDDVCARAGVTAARAFEETP